MIFRNTPQWFVAIDKPLDDGMDTYGATIRERALTSIDRAGDVDAAHRAQPALLDGRGAARLGAEPPARLGRAADLLREAAAPTATAEILRDPAVNARIVAAFEAEGADAWFAEGAKARFLGNDHDPDDVGAGDRHPRRLVRLRLDPRLRAARPAGRASGRPSLYLEGTDQHRGWFQSSLLQACGTRGPRALRRRC